MTEFHPVYRMWRNVWRNVIALRSDKISKISKRDIQQFINKLNGHLRTNYNGRYHLHRNVFFFGVFFLFSLHYLLPVIITLCLQVLPYFVMDIFDSTPGMPGVFLAALFSASLRYIF